MSLCWVDSPKNRLNHWHAHPQAGGVTKEELFMGRNGAWICGCYVYMQVGELPKGDAMVNGEGNRQQATEQRPWG